MKFILKNTRANYLPKLAKISAIFFSKRQMFSSVMKLMIMKEKTFVRVSHIAFFGTYISSKRS